MNIFNIVFDCILYCFLYIPQYILAMSEVARNAFVSRNYRLTTERNLKEEQDEFNFSYADSLAKCGKFREALPIYSYCYRKTPQYGGTEHLRHLSISLLDSIVSGGNFKLNSPKVIIGLSCVLCEDVLNEPVTLVCGHTVCKKCEIKDHKSKNCKKCAQPKTHKKLETNFLVKKLVEKAWPNLISAAKLKDEGNELFQSGNFEDALQKYNEANLLAPESAPVLSNRSHVLLRLNRPQMALKDAEVASTLRPHWGKPQYRRGMALAALGRLEEALQAFGCCVTLDRSSNAVRHEVATVLHRLLAPPANVLNFRQCRGPSPYWKSNQGNSSTKFRLNRRASFLSSVRPTMRSSGVGSSDCEDEYSGDEDVHMAQVNHSPSSVQTNQRLHGIIDRLFQSVEKIKRCAAVNGVEGNGWVAQAIGRVESTDFECSLCCCLLWKPVTTPCGHTYCWTCLDRCLDYELPCPLCLAPLTDCPASHQRMVTELIDFALQTLLPEEYAARQSQNEAELRDIYGEPDSVVPIFVCVTAFPSIACPLSVFEPRYRLMVRRAVESGHKRFGMTACINGNATGHERYGEFGTMLEIREQVCKRSGSSLLATVGQKRFRVLQRSEIDGYDRAKIEYISDEAISEDNLPEVCRLHDLTRRKASLWWSTLAEIYQKEFCEGYGAMPEAEQDWMTLPDGPSWVWWLLAVLPLAPQFKVAVIGITSLTKRFKVVNRILDHLARLHMESVSKSRQPPPPPALEPISDHSSSTSVQL